MNSTTRTVLIAIVVVIIIALLGYFAWSEQQGSAPQTPATSLSTSTMPSIPIGTTTTNSSNPGYVIKSVPVSNGSAPTPPNYAAPLVFTSTMFSASDETIIQGEFSQMQTALKEDPTDLNAWIELGTLREEAGDYAGAGADWQYVSALSPTNIVSFANLGDLYANYLHEYPQASTEYKQQLVNDPTDVAVYMALYSLYTNQYPQSSATVEALLQQGIAANPSNTQLKATLSAYTSAK